MSFYCVLKVVGPGLLLGGVKQTKSSRFETFKQAVRFGNTSCEINKQARPDLHIDCGIYESRLPAEITEADTN